MNKNKLSSLLKDIKIKMKEGFSNQKFSYGLDLGSAEVKLVKLYREKEKVELNHFICRPQKTDTGALLKEIITLADCRRVNISLSGPGALIRYAIFPKMKREDLEQSLQFEAQKHIPFSVSDVYLDGHILKDDLPDNKMMVLLACAKKDFVNQRIKVFEGIGIDIGIIDIDSLSIINAFNFNYSEILQNEYKNKPIALLHIGSSTTSVNILQNGIPCLSRDILIGGNNLTQRIAELLNLDFKRAEELKCGREGSATFTQALEFFLANLAREIRISFDYFESQNAANISKIFLSGGTAKLDRLKESLEGLLNIPTEEWDPLRKIIVSSSVDTEVLRKFQIQLAVAIGLALRG